MDVSYDPDALKAVSLLPQSFQSIFDFRYFNSIQSESFQEAFLSDDNLIISAPTGSGKTVLFELCILRLLTRCLTTEGNFEYTTGSLKMIYIAPLKSLVQEKLRDWNKKFGRVLNFKCQELTGDTELFNIRDLQEVDIILTTPEKLDSITRRHRDYGGLSFFGDIALLMIDEVHLLSDPRGAALEAVISRMKMLARYPEMKGCPLANIRFVAVSATIPNIEDLAEWLMVPKQGVKRFGEEVRPVKLTTKVYGYAPAKNDFLFERRLQSFLFDILTQHSKGKAALIFCSTRKGAQEAAMTLSETVSKRGSQNPFIKTYDQFERLQVAALACNDKHMQTCIRSGVGYHNGGLGLTERSLVEGLFLKGDLQVLCTTSTLAHGVNLPAHTVIIKSTQYFSKEKGGYVEYDRASILQMCGRAGRPQFDDSGVVIIMTRRDTVHLYENLLSGCEPVESQLLPSIAEHLNAEIVLLTVSDVSLAIDWLKCSFLYVRIKKNPEHYKIQECGSIEQLENKLKDICVQNVNQLSTYGLIQTDEEGYVLRPLEPGRLMAKYYLYFETMKVIVRSTAGSTIQDLLHILSLAQELKWIKLRRNEKKLLNDINCETSGRIRFHVTSPNGKIKKRIQTVEEKIYILTNDALSGEPSTSDFTMNQDINGICSNGTRIARCMSDYFIFMKRFKDSINALLLSKCLHQRLWEDSPFQLKQLAGVGMVTAKALLHAGINSFEKLLSADPRRLESLTGRKYPFGNHVKESLDALPPVIEMRFLDESYTKQGVKYTLILDRTSPSRKFNKRHFADLVVGTEGDNKLLFHEKIRLEQFCSPYQITIHCSAVPQNPEAVSAALVSEEYVGVDVKAKLTIKGVKTENAIWKERNIQCIEGNQTCETKGLNKILAQIRPPDIERPRLLLEKDSPNQPPKCTGQSKEPWETGSFSGPSFSLLPDDCRSPDSVVTHVSKEGEQLPEPEENPGKRKDNVTTDNVFDHIKKKSRKLACFNPDVHYSDVIPNHESFKKKLQESLSTKPLPTTEVQRFEIKGDSLDKGDLILNFSVPEGTEFCDPVKEYQQPGSIQAFSDVYSGGSFKDTSLASSQPLFNKQSVLCATILDHSFSGEINIPCFMGCKSIFSFL